MPKIETSEKMFFNMLGREMTDDELIDIFPVAKAELDGHDVEHHILKIELGLRNGEDVDELIIGHLLSEHFEEHFFACFDLRH